MNDNMMFEYLLEMGAMQPEQEELKRKQAMVQALRDRSADTPQGQMIGKHYVPPSLTQYAAQMGQGYAAGQGQKTVDANRMELMQKQLAALRKRKGMDGDATAAGYDPLFGVQ